jgi:4-amino-4-deoxy-L-arabinose transferase-like glycosyltransferase
MAPSRRPGASPRAMPGDRRDWRGVPRFAAKDCAEVRAQERVRRARAHTRYPGLQLALTAASGMNNLAQRNTARRWALAIFLCGLAAGLVMVFGAFRAQALVRNEFDPYYFGEMGKSLARGDGFTAFGTLLKRRSPLYPMLIGGIYFLFGEQPQMVLLLQCLLFAGTCVLTFDMGRRVFNLRTGIVAGALCVIQPLMLRYIADLHLETFLTFLFTLTIWCTVRFYQQPTIARGIALGVSGAAAALTKAVVVLYPALFVGTWIALRLLRRNQRRERGPSLAAVCAIAVTMLLLILPWTVRNYYATNGRFVLISSGFNDAFLRGYVFSQPEYALLKTSPYIGAENASNAWFRSLAERAGTVWERDDYETEQILGREVRVKLANEPREFIRKSVVGLFTFWYEMTTLTNSLVVGLFALAAWACAGVGFARAWREQRPLWLFLLPGLHLNLLLAVLLALGRYSAPIMPALLVASAFGIDTLVNRFVSRTSHSELVAA